MVLGTQQKLRTTFGAGFGWPVRACVLTRVWPPLEQLLQTNRLVKVYADRSEAMG